MRSSAAVFPLLGLLLWAGALAAQEPAPLSLEGLFHPDRQVAYVEPPQIALHWTADGTLVQEWLERDARHGLERRLAPGWEPRPLLGRAQFSAALAGCGLDERAADQAWRAPFLWSPAGDAFLITSGQDFYRVDLADRISARQVTRSPDPKEAPRFSPDGSQLAYLRGADLYVTDLATGRETRLTQGGGPDHLNGRLDWLYQEEIFRGEDPGAFWWSPDSKRIAFLSLDESQVPSYTLMDDASRPRRALTYRYPMAGEANPEARLGVAGLDGRVTWMEDPFPATDTLVVGVGWDPRGRLVANFQDRAQTWLACVRFEAMPITLVREEAREGWMERQPLPLFLADGFLWRSARAGFQHLYRYDGQGRLKAALTAGPWDVRAVQGVDEAAGRVYFEATQRNAIGLDAYSADLDGELPNANLRRLTDRPGTHELVYNSAFSAAVDRFSELESPPQQLLPHPGRTPAASAGPPHRQGLPVLPPGPGQLPAGADPGWRRPGNPAGAAPRLRSGPEIPGLPAGLRRPRHAAGAQRLQRRPALVPVPGPAGDRHLGLRQPQRLGQGRQRPGHLHATPARRSCATSWMGWPG